MSNPWIRRRGHREMPVPASNRSAQEMRIQRRDKKSFTERNEMDFFTSLYKNEKEILKRVSKFERNPAPINTYEVNSDIYSTSIISRQPIAQLYYDESVYQLDVNKKKPMVTTQTLKKKKKRKHILVNEPNIGQEIDEMMNEPRPMIIIPSTPNIVERQSI